jgi:hypothetical protein
MGTVYRKTAKGQAEVETRAHRLLPRLRTALILVDGRRDEDELLKLIPGEPEATVKTLLEDGFIEIVAITVDKTPANDPATTRPADLGPGSSFNPKAFEQHRQAAVRSLNDQLGPTAEVAAMKLERCKTWDELMPALEFARRIVESAKGPAAAAEFGRQFIEAPPR